MCSKTLRLIGRLRIKLIPASQKIDSNNNKKKNHYFVLDDMI